MGAVRGKYAIFLTPLNHSISAPGSRYKFCCLAVTAHYSKMMMHVAALLLFSTHFLALGGKTPMSCETSQDCPGNFVCKSFDSQHMCVCDIGYQPNYEGSECFKVVELNGDCTKTGTICRRGPWGQAACMNGKCGCPVGYLQEGDTTCVMDTMVRDHVALLGRPCSKSRHCLFPRSQICDDGICKCRKNLKMAGDDFRSAMPIIDECIPEAFVFEPL